MRQHIARDTAAQAREFQLAGSVSRLLLSLYQLAATERIGVFEQRVFDLLHEHMDFDSAWLGHSTLTPLGPRLHSSHTHNAAPDFLADWEQVKGQDPLVGLVAGGPGRTVALSVPREPLALPLRALCRRHGIAHVLCGAHFAAPAHRTTHLSLYRKPRRQAYAERDLWVLECVIAHLAAALEQNRLCRMREMRSQGNATEGTAIALFDASGFLQYADESFCELMALEWREWNGITLPGEARHALLHAHGAGFTGACVWLSGERVGDLVLLRAGTRGAVSVLTPRELAVARLFAAGQTHKVVARQLGIAPTTVRHHLRQAYAKLGIGDKGALAGRLRP
ncbi:helix-turn-helix transcriptional regulator [Cupriavidus sp. 8B]